MRLEIISGNTRYAFGRLKDILWSDDFWGMVRSLTVILGLLNLVAGAVYVFSDESLEWSTNRLVLGLAMVVVAEHAGKKGRRQGE